MRNFFKILYKKVIQTYLLYKVLTLFFQFIDKVYKYRVELENDLKKRSEVLSKNIFNSQKVLNGPFKGLNYSDIQSKGSQLYPKLLGSYEEELQDHLNFILSKKPDLIIDIGCAEGYYAVGIAFKLKENDCKIIAIDIDKQALNECKVLADRNNIKEKLKFKNSFSEDEYKSLKDSNRPLVICDCEGCEATFFTSDNLNKFERADLIIELHEFAVPDVEEKLLNIFSKSHSVKIVKEKRKSFNKYPQLRGFNYFQKRYLLDERRPVKMKWLLASSNYHD